MKRENKILTTVVVSVCVLFAIIFTAILAYKKGMEHKTIIVHADFNDIYEESENEESWRYTFLEKDKSNYIERLSKELKIDSDLAVAILIQENPEFNPSATHINANGTIDCGFFQLNDRYVYSAFVKSYWDFSDVEFNVFNWKHNTFIALHHIQYLCESLKILDEVIMAYNCGAGAVMNQKIPDSTKVYFSRVKNNIQLLKDMQRVESYE